MANNAVDMSKLKQVLRMFKNGGMSNRKIAETVDLDMNTVNKYVNQAKKDSMSIDELLSLDDPVLAHRIVGGNAAYKDTCFDELKPKFPYYASELKRPHVTMQLFWEEYRNETAHPYGLTQFKEHLNKYITGTTEKTASTILEDCLRRAMANLRNVKSPKTTSSQSITSYSASTTYNEHLTTQSTKRSIFDRLLQQEPNRGMLHIPLKCEAVYDHTSYFTSYLSHQTSYIFLLFSSSFTKHTGTPFP